jgi:hypothetical protein
MQVLTEPAEPMFQQNIAKVKNDRRNAENACDARVVRGKDKATYAYCSNFNCLALTSAVAWGRRAMFRPSTRSSPVTNSAAPTGRPVTSDRRNAVTASSRSCSSKSAKQTARSSAGRTANNQPDYATASNSGRTGRVETKINRALHRSGQGRLHVYSAE